MANMLAPSAIPTRTAARTAAFMPGESPPLVNTAMRIGGEDDVVDVVVVALVVDENDIYSTR